MLAPDMLVLSASFRVMVAVTPVAASPSVKVNARGSIAAKTGASFTGTTSISLLTVFDEIKPSDTETLTVLVAPEGLLLLVFW